MDGEGKTHARVGTAAAIVGVALACGGVVVNYIEWREAVAIARHEQVQTNRALGSIREDIEKLRDELDAVKNRKDDMPARLEERMVAMQKQLDRIEKRVWRW